MIAAHKRLDLLLGDGLGTRALSQIRLGVDVTAGVGCRYNFRGGALAAGGRTNAFHSSIYSLQSILKR
jgi:hypothetical protein